MKGNISYIAISALLSSLVACGGGGGSAGTTPSPGEEPGPTNPAPEGSNFSALIEWDIPTTRVNGDDLLLSEIDGYEIQYRKTDQEDFTSITVNDGSTDNLVLEGLSAGEYEVKIAVFDTSNNFSIFSGAVTQDIGD